MGVDHVRMWRFEDDTVTTVASPGTFDSAMPVGLREPVDHLSLAGLVRHTRRSQRVENYDEIGGGMAERALEIGVGSAVATPIVVEGRIWGAMVAVCRHPRRLPADTEAQMDQFTELMATAIANTESRARADRLAEEQAALRRVATLVAEGALASAVFDAVVAEVEALLDANQVALHRFEPDDEILVLAHRGLDAGRTPVGSRVSAEGGSATARVRRAGRPARMEDYERAAGALAQRARAAGLRSSVAAPVVVDGRLWGLIAAGWKREPSPPADTEQRMDRFAELLATAIANAESRDQLTASRTRLLTAGDEARRRVVRDLHDGAQQRLVHTIMTLKLAARALRAASGDAELLLGEALAQAERANQELRELSHGILPSVLTRGGLRAGIDSLVARLDLQVDVEVRTGRLQAEIEASAYFIVAEALTNVVKHAHATRAEVRASAADGVLRVEVRDDGVGGADRNGHGLLGMADRATALGGRFDIDSPPTGGTTVLAVLPI